MTSLQGTSLQYCQEFQKPCCGSLVQTFLSWISFMSNILLPNQLSQMIDSAVKTHSQSWYFIMQINKHPVSISEIC